MNRPWLPTQPRASPQVVRLAVMTAVPAASAVKEVCGGTQPRPGISGQVPGRGRRLAGRPAHYRGRRTTGYGPVVARQDQFEPITHMYVHLLAAGAFAAHAKRPDDHLASAHPLQRRHDPDSASGLRGRGPRSRAAHRRESGGTVHPAGNVTILSRTSWHLLLRGRAFAVWRDQALARLRSVNACSVRTYQGIERRSFMTELNV